MPTNPIIKRDTFLAEPYQHIDPAVTVENGGASSRHFRVIGAVKSDWGSNFIYFDVFDKSGWFLHPVTVAWNWLENADKAPKPATGDKPIDQEPSGNIGMIGGVHIWLEAWDDVSERAVFPPPDGTSWYVVFQLVDVSEPIPEPEPTPDDPPDSGSPPATPENLAIKSFTDTTITLTWSMPDDDPTAWAERFRVSWSTNMVDWQQLTAQSMQATVPNLSPDTLYLFRVQAVNQFGKSPPAEIPGRTAKPQKEPPMPGPPATKTAGKWRVSMPPGQILVIPLRGDMVDQADLHTEKNPYVLVEFSRAELERILAGMTARGEEFVNLGITLVPREEYDG